MEKRLANLSELIVDTSFLLPLVGIKVKGIKDELLEGKAIYYPSLMLTELLAVIFKEAKKLKLGKVPEEAMKGLIYVLNKFSSLLEYHNISLLASMQYLLRFYSLFPNSCKNDQF